MFEIHDQKTQIIEHIDRGEIGVEFQRVKQDRRAIQQADIGKVKIAMAVADMTGGSATIYQSGMAFGILVQAGDQRVALFGAQAIFAGVIERVSNTSDQAKDCRGTRLPGADRGLVVIGGDAVCESRAELMVEPAP